VILAHPFYGKLEYYDLYREKKNGFTFRCSSGINFERSFDGPRETPLALICCCFKIRCSSVGGCVKGPTMDSVKSGTIKRIEFDFRKINFTFYL
jgi:hypothetical protein